MTTGNSSPLALCTVISRTPSLPSSRIGASARLARRRGAQLVDEAAERDAAARLVLPRQLGDVQHVGERLLAGRPQDEADVRARLGRAAGRSCRRPGDSCGRGAAAAAAAARRRSAPGARSARRSAPAPAPELPPSSCGIRNGWNVPNRCRNSSSCSSSIAKSDPLSVANTDSSSSGHSIAASAARIVSTSSRPWNALPPTSRCGMPRASIAST